MMHEAMSKSSSPPTNYYSRKPDEMISNNQSKSNNARDALNRRPQSVGLQKGELASLSSANNANGGGRWRMNSSGQLVDMALAEWDIADDMVKLQINENGTDIKGRIRTPPQNKNGVAVGLENSPLETSSDTSLGSESPNDQPINLISHSRGSSADTSASRFSSNSQALHAGPITPLKMGAMESRNRPHSYSGGLSSADLIRLQQAGGSPNSKAATPNGTPERPSQAEQPTYPSLASQNGYARSQDQQIELDYQQRQFTPNLPSSGATPTSAYPSNRRSSNAPLANMQFRQQGTPSFTPQLNPILQSPTNFGYPTPLVPSVQVNAGQQLYEMMMPQQPLENPGITRIQQQSAPFRPGHQHSASDPASLRDPATLAMQAAFAAGQMYPAVPPPALALFASQFYGAQPQDLFQSPDLNMMARLQAQYPGAYGLPLPTPQVNIGPGGSIGSGALTPTGTNGVGPSANNRKLGLYKTELCRSWEEKGTCRYGAKCQFAHGEDELKKVQRHPKYKTEICRTFWVSGSCPYGKRCCFIHTELPGSGNQGGQDSTVPTVSGDGRPRSDSDPNEVPTSLLARISAKRAQDSNVNSAAGSVSTTPPAAGFVGRPGGLKVDTSVLDAAAKQNKSAFPTFTHNPILMPINDDPHTMSPGPVTAAPDFGRHAAARMDIVGTQRLRKAANIDSNVRHSLNGSDIQLDFNTPTPTATNQPAQFSVTDTPRARIHGHVRSGSAGNWGTATRSTNLTNYPLSSIPGNELKANIPWAEYNVSSRLAEKTWG